MKTLILLLFFCSFGFGAIALDKNNAANCSALDTCSPQTVTINATAGSRILIQVFWCAVGCGISTNTGDITSISDGSDTIVSNNFCSVAATGSNFGVKSFYVTSAVGGTLTLTVTWGVGVQASYSAIMWSSWTGIQGVPDQTGCGNGQSGTTITATTSGNLGASNELIIGFGIDSTVTLGAGFSGINTVANAGILDEYKIGGTSGSTTSATFPFTGTTWVGMVTTFAPQVSSLRIRHKVSSQ